MPIRRTPHVARLHRGAPRAADPAADLTGLVAGQWEAIDSSVREPLMKSIDARYKVYLKGFYDTANLCTERHDMFVHRHRMWRYTAIVGTGLLACLNFAAARESSARVWSSTLPIAASVGALLLSVLANLETFGNSAEQAQAYRDSRELYLDTAQEYDRAWSIAVVALGTSAQAYANGIELYKRIIAADSELRRSFKEVNKGRS